MDTIGQTGFPVFFLIPLTIWLAVIVFVVVMSLRLVRGVERIAQALERRAP